MKIRRYDPRSLTALLAVLALAAGGCGGNDEDAGEAGADGEAAVDASSDETEEPAETSPDDGEDPAETSPDDGEDTGDASEGVEPGDTTLVVGGGPGSGADIIARQLTGVLAETGITDGVWPVENVSDGAGAAAMGFLVENEGNDEMVAISSLGWLSTPLELGEGAITYEDLTPICQLIVEPAVMAVVEDSPFNSLTDFIEAAESGEDLIQVGGQVASINDLARRQLQEETGTEWTYLPVESGGERIPQIIRGDADMILGSPADFVGQTVDEGGDLRIIATIGPERTELYPDAPTHHEEGYDFEIGLAFRGLTGPPGMSDEAVQYYEDACEEVLQTEAWQEIAEENGYTNQFRPRDEWSEFQAGWVDTLSEMMGT